MGRVVEAVAPARLGPGFRWLLASTWVSNLGDGLALASGPLLVASQTHSPRLVALASLLQRLPWLLFALPAGAIADRLDRRLIVVTVDLVRGVVLALLSVAIATGTVNIAIVLVVMFVLGTAEVFADNSSATLLPMLVARADLAIANSRLQAGFVTVNQLVGPPIGAALFAMSMTAPFAVETAMVVAGAALIAKISLPRQDPQPLRLRSMATDITEGFRWVVRHPAMRTLVLTILTFNVTFGAAWSVLVLYAKEHLHAGSIGFGLLTTAGAVGGLLATFAYGWLTRRISLGNLMRIGLILETLTHLALASTSHLAVAMTIFFVFGAHAFVWGATSTTIRQRAVPTELQGRVTSLNALGSFGGIVVGAALGGEIASRWGITAPFWFGFVGSGVFVILIWRQLRHIAHDDEPPPTEVVPAGLWPEETPTS